jgi:transcriptional regulator with XRE-family HTH domain
MSTNEQLEALGRAVTERRAQIGLSQAEAARRWGVDRSWLSDVERGAANPSFESILALAARMDVSLAELFRRAEELRGG